MNFIVNKASLYERNSLEKFKTLLYVAFLWDICLVFESFSVLLNDISEFHDFYHFYLA